MILVIKMIRIGRKNHPSFKIVASHQHKTPVHILGSFVPTEIDEKQLYIKDYNTIFTLIKNGSKFTQKIYMYIKKDIIKKMNDNFFSADLILMANYFLQKQHKLIK